MSLVTAEALRSGVKNRRRTTEVELEGIGTIRLRGMSAGEALEFRAEVAEHVKAGGDAEALAPIAIARSLIDEAGEPLFADAEEGAAILLELPTHEYTRLADAFGSLRSSRTVEDAEKNSAASRSDSSPTGSPTTSDTPA